MRIFFLILFATTLSAQVTATVSPPTVPLGCPVTVVLTNDTSAPVGTAVCPFLVFDASGSLVYGPPCILILQWIPPGGTFVTQWDQVNNFGAQVPPGQYQVDVTVPGVGVTTHAVTLTGQAGMALANLGAPRIGTNRALRITAPQEASRPFILAASLGASGLFTCGGAVPLSWGPLFEFSLIQPNPVFQGFLGALDGNGWSEAPSLNIPNDPSLTGLAIYLAGLTYDTSAPCGIRAISAVLPVVLL